MKIKMVMNDKTGEMEPQEYESIVWSPITVSVNNRHGKGMKQRTVIAETMVFLYDAKEWKDVMDKREDDTRINPPFPADVLKPVSVGLALCSDKDQYSRKIGLVIATDRALKHYVDCRIPIGDRES